MTRRTGKAQRVCLQFVIVPVVILLERVRLAKLLTSARLMKPQQNPQSRWTSVTSTGSSQQATLLRAIIHYSAEGQERGERSRQHCYQEKENGTPKAPPIYTIPFLPHVLPKVMLPSISIPRGPSVKAEEKPLSLQKKAVSSLQQVEKVPVGILSIPTTCHSFHL